MFSLFSLYVDVQYKGSVARMRLVYDTILKGVSSKDASFSGDFKRFYFFLKFNQLSVVIGKVGRSRSYRSTLIHIQW